MPLTREAAAAGAMQSWYADDTTSAGALRRMRTSILTNHRNLNPLTRHAESLDFSHPGWHEKQVKKSFSKKRSTLQIRTAQFDPAVQILQLCRVRSGNGHRIYCCKNRDIRGESMSFQGNPVSYKTVTFPGV